MKQILCSECYSNLVYSLYTIFKPRLRKLEFCTNLDQIDFECVFCHFQGIVMGKILRDFCIFIGLIAIFMMSKQRKSLTHYNDFCSFDTIL